MDAFRTEEEQLEALRRWWDENGRSTVVAIIIALAAGFGWQGWKGYQQGQSEQASDMYQAMLRGLSADVEGAQGAVGIGERLKAEFSGSTYAQFAALHLAAFAVERGDLGAAEAELRWALGHADSGSDVAQIARMRLARVVAARGDSDGALAILGDGSGAYTGAYAVARGDILLSAGRVDAAREAYSSAQAAIAAGGQSGVNLPSLQAKLQSVSPVPPTQGPAAGTGAGAEPLPAGDSGETAVEGPQDVDD